MMSGIGQVAAQRAGGIFRNSIANILGCPQRGRIGQNIVSGSATCTS